MKGKILRQTSCVQLRNTNYLLAAVDLFLCIYYINQLINLSFVNLNKWCQRIVLHQEIRITFIFKKHYNKMKEVIKFLDRYFLIMKEFTL